MKILVLNGSPKKDGSDTMHLTREFLQGMEEIAPQEVEIVHVAERSIGHCRGCMACMRNGGTCAQRDDMDEIFPKLLDSELVLFSFPLYWYGMPGQLKTLVDRLLPMGSLAMERVNGHVRHVAQKDTSRIRWMAICGCGFPHVTHNFEGLEKQLELAFGEETVVITVPEAPLLGAQGAEGMIAPVLANMRKAGREYAQLRAVSNETLFRLAVPMLREKEYVALVNAQVAGPDGE